MVHILGIRHHGVGSAQNVVARLRVLQPDLLLVEGAPELDAAIEWLSHEDTQPPVALLGYNQAAVQQAVFYPFTEFSPEFQAILYAKQHNIPCRMLDLPLSIGFQIEQNEAENIEKTGNSDENKGEDTIDNISESEQKASKIYNNPIANFAKIDAYEDSEAWWEAKFEQKFDENTAEQHFEAVMLMMQTLRSSDVFSPAHEQKQQNDIREAYMRQIIRKAENEMFANIVVVCGAWHAPALLDLHNWAKEDAKTIKALPKTRIKTAVTLIPWTNERLATASGYGAGITSPGWYEHLWQVKENTGIHWLAKVADRLRREKIDISTAHVIETYRLAEAVSTLRGYSRISLSEYQEATQTVMCMGDSILLQLIVKDLIISNKIGAVPNNIPKLPLQSDFEDCIKKLKLPLSSERKSQELDLRKPLDLQRSIFIFRLQILKIDWAKAAYSRSKGTFKEAWWLKWQPEMMIRLIEQAINGNTVESAAAQTIRTEMLETRSIAALAEMINAAIPAELFEIIEELLQEINKIAAIAADIIELMTAIVPLVAVTRYGNVRQTDKTTLRNLTETLFTRIAIGLPTTCYGTDDDTAYRLFDHIRKVHEAVRLLQTDALSKTWQQTLFAIADKKEGINSLLLGCTCRLLFDIKAISAAEMAIRFEFALSSGNETTNAVRFIEGFLKGSGMILLYDEILWRMLYEWVSRLSESDFEAMLPILRRTFAHFEPAERRRIGEKVKQEAHKLSESDEKTNFITFDTAAAEEMLPNVASILGL